MGEYVKAEVTAFRWPIATVSCPPGKRLVLGGGVCRSAGPEGFVFIVKSAPINENQYQVHCDTAIMQNVVAEAYAICYIY